MGVYTAQAPALSPARRGGPSTLLVGTPMAVAQLSHALGGLDPAPHVVGWLRAGPVHFEAPEIDIQAPKLGAAEALDAVLHDQAVQQVLLSLPAAMVQQIRMLAAALDVAGCRWRFVPMLLDQLEGRTVLDLGTGPAPAVDTKGLLCRSTVPVDEEAIRSVLANKTVMITSAISPMGLALTKRIASYSPSRLVLVDQAPPQPDKIAVQGGTKRATVQVDLTDRARTRSVVALQHPSIIFHPTVGGNSDDPVSALEDHFYTTRSIVDAARVAGTNRLLMVDQCRAVGRSVDAANWLSRWYVSRSGASSRAGFCTVQLGRVLGPDDPHLRRWTQQMAKGGPVVVSAGDDYHRLVTMDEAVDLVLQCASFDGPASAGAVFLAERGEPVRNHELARRFVASCGLLPHVDIELRPDPSPSAGTSEIDLQPQEMVATAHPSIGRMVAPVVSARSIEQLVAKLDRLRGPDDPTQRWSRAHRLEIEQVLGQIDSNPTSSAAP